MHYKFLSVCLIVALMIASSIARPLATSNDEIHHTFSTGLNKRGVVQDSVDVARKIRGKSGQAINGLTPAQQFCAYQSTQGSAGLHQLQHKIQNAVLGGSLECTIVQSLDVKSPEGPKTQSEGQVLSDPIPAAVDKANDDSTASQSIGGANSATHATK